MARSVDKAFKALLAKYRTGEPRAPLALLTAPNGTVYPALSEPEAPVVPDLASLLPPGEPPQAPFIPVLPQPQPPAQPRPDPLAGAMPLPLEE